ncbi:methylaspartate mutase [Kitasatospora sp. NPDC006697]|uniref:methylaspartate mutase n=1 Tax=Kitasatospora sp. NPDC006697 TaxID=3364020 RepID=UPI0036A696F3
MSAIPTDLRPSTTLTTADREAARPAAKVILGVAASDSHAVANHLIAFQLRQLGYQVVNLGPCTPVSEFADCHAENGDALAVVIGSINGHALEDLAPLRAVRDQGLLDCPVIVGGNLSVGSAKTGREGDALLALGVDHVLQDVDELVGLLEELRAEAARAELHPARLETVA